LDIFSKGGSSALTAIMLAERRGDEKANHSTIWTQQRKIAIRSRRRAAISSRPQRNTDKRGDDAVTTLAFRSQTTRYMTTERPLLNGIP
jgi:hypothetical protein